jgi:site-specific DNA recombinase
MSEQAGIWLRVSTTGQDEESQLPDNTRWCESHGYDVAETYTIHGKSAFKGSRKFDAMWSRVIDDMHSGRITVLVVWKTDRLDRKLNTFQMLAEVVAAGGRVEFVTQPHLNDLTTMGGRIALKVQEEIAHAESKDKSDRIRIKHNSLRTNGSVIGRPAFGYRIEKRDGAKVFVPTATGRRYIPQIFQRCIDGESLRSIAAWLDSQGVSTISGQSWDDRYIGNRLIRNPVYYGQRRNAGQLETEALVSYSIWQQANAALVSRVKPGRSTVKREKPLLSPVCGNPECDASGQHPSPMYRYSTRSYEYYRCTGSGPQRKGCGNAVSVESADEWVTEAISGDPNPHTEREFVPGDDRSDEIGKLRQAAMTAYLNDDRAAFERLDSEARELESEPATVAHWEERLIGPCAVVADGPDEKSAEDAKRIRATHALCHHRTVGEWFAGLDASQRREELAQRWIVSLDKNGAGIVPRNWP